jgi:sulfite reductase (NADPH) flavoprotein alpha-component
LQSAERALFIASTYGEGDPPDNASVFASRVMSGPALLPQLHFAVLALGDREYANYCGFGRALDEWLQAHGAMRLFARVEANNSDPQALEQWRHHLSHLAGTDDLPDWEAPAFEPWRLTARAQRNAGSAGAPVFHLELQPADGRTLPAWQSGDLAQILAPADADRARDYSIASIPADGSLHILVREERHPDGTLGVCSGWLTTQLQIGATLSVRVRAHENFRLGANATRPLLLIGNGTGIAGLRSHLKTRSAANAGQQWLVFGERNAAFDGLYREELDNWQRSGVLGRVDLVYSRDQAQRRYVQHLLLECADEVRAWIARDAAIYVCGSLEGMAGGVEAALRDILGAAAVEQLSAQGRYRRDVY